MDTHLRKTGKKLALQFSVIILLLLWILGIIFFAIRAYAFHEIYEKHMNEQTVNIQRVLDEEKPNKKIVKKLREFLLIEKDTLKIVKNNQRAFEPFELLENFDKNNIPQYPQIIEKDNDVFRIIIQELTDKKSNNQYYIFHIQRMPFNPKFFLYEAYYFILFTFILSFLIYFIGYYLAFRNLKPVQEMIQKLRHFTHDASHELKTPISVIYSDLQLAKKTKKYEQAIDSSLEEIKSLNGLIDKLLSLAKPEKDMNKQEHNISTLTQNIIKKHEVHAKNKEIILSKNIENSIRIHCNKEQFQIAMKNLIENAIKYSPKRSTVCIMLSKKYIQVQDSGIGISKCHIQRIFDRFYQEDNSRNSDGFGIGLSLVKKIVDEHNWKIEVQSKKGKGSTFTIYF